MNYKIVSLVVLVASSGVALGMEPQPTEVFYALNKRNKHSEGVEVLKNVQFGFFMDLECKGGDRATVLGPEFVGVNFPQYQLENIMQEFKDTDKKNGTIEIEENETKGNCNRSTRFVLFNVSEKNIKQVLALKTARERLCKLQPNNGQPVKNMRVLGKDQGWAEREKAHFTTPYGSPYLQYKDQAGNDVRVPIAEEDIKAIGEALELNRETVRALGMFFTPDPGTSTGENTLNYERFVDLEDVQGIYKTIRMYKYLIRGGFVVSIGAIIAAMCYFWQK